MRKASIAVFEALSHPLRLKMVELLARKERRMEQLTKLVGINPSSVTHHLVVLRNAKLLRTERRGKPAYHTLDKRVMTDALADLRNSLQLTSDE